MDRVCQMCPIKGVSQGCLISFARSVEWSCSLNGILFFTLAAFLLPSNVFSPATQSTSIQSRLGTQTPGGARRHPDLPGMLVWRLPSALDKLSEPGQGPLSSEQKQGRENRHRLSALLQLCLFLSSFRARHGCGITAVPPVLEYKKPCLQNYHWQEIKGNH